MLVSVWQAGQEVAYAQSTSPMLAAMGRDATAAAAAAAAIPSSSSSCCWGSGSSSNTASPTPSPALTPKYNYGPETRFRIFSMTKPIVSVCIQIAIQQGKLSLEDPVSKYIPKVAEMQVFQSESDEDGSYTSVPQHTPMTVRHLLTHTSGLSYGYVFLCVCICVCACCNHVLSMMIVVSSRCPFDRTAVAYTQCCVCFRWIKNIHTNTQYTQSRKIVCSACL